jgi:hypothetical protein
LKLRHLQNYLVAEVGKFFFKQSVFTLLLLEEGCCFLNEISDFMEIQS